MITRRLHLIGLALAAVLAAGPALAAETQVAVAANFTEPAKAITPAASPEVTNARRIFGLKALQANICRSLLISCPVDLLRISCARFPCVIGSDS